MLSVRYQTGAAPVAERSCARMALPRVLTPALLPTERSRGLKAVHVNLGVSVTATPPSAYFGEFDRLVRHCGIGIGG
jgi:hypothetical protein